MKIRLLLLALLLARPLASASTAPNLPPATDDLLPIEQLADPRMLRRGMTRGEVHARLGAPAQVLPPEVWVYWDFTCGLPGAREGGFDALIVKFEDGRVWLAKVVNGERLRALLAAARVPVRGRGPAMAGG